MPFETSQKVERNLLVREAARCLRLADALTDARTVKTLRLMAQDYERRARGMSAETA